MKLEKAIEILTSMGTPDFRGHTEDILAARKLGVAAITRISNERINPGNYKDLPLPGETDE